MIVSGLLRRNRPGDSGHGKDQRRQPRKKAGDSWMHALMVADLPAACAPGIETPARIVATRRRAEKISLFGT